MAWKNKTLHFDGIDCRYRKKCKSPNSTDDISKVDCSECFSKYHFKQTGKIFIQEKPYARADVFFKVHEHGHECYRVTEGKRKGLNLFFSSDEKYITCPICLGVKAQRSSGLKPSVYYAIKDNKYISGVNENLGYTYTDKKESAVQGSPRYIYSILGCGFSPYYCLTGTQILKNGGKL